MNGLPSKDNVELLNTITYKNYGQLAGSNSVSLSNHTNNLALATDKCLILLNYNFDWPSSIYGHTPYKYFYSSSGTDGSLKSSQTANFDSWLQELHECKNESFYVNTIRSVPKSTKYFDMCRRFFKLDGIKTNKARTSFGKRGRQTSSLNNSSAKNKNDSQSNSLEELIEEERLDEEFQNHTHLFNQTLLLDPYLNEFLSSLNPFNHSTSSNLESQQQQKKGFDGYQFCSWNTRRDLKLLFTITNCNQMVLFDLTRLVISPNTNIDLKLQENQQIEDGWVTIDHKTETKLINLTETWLAKYRPDCLESQTVSQFLININRVIPVTATWADQSFNTNSSINYELLFIAFKSNEIGIFVLAKDSELVIELYDSITLDQPVVDQDEMFESNLDSNNKMLISSIKFISFNSSYGILVVGFQTGQVAIKVVELDSNRIESLISNGSNKTKPSNIQNHEWAYLKSVAYFGRVENIHLVKLDSTNRLLVCLQFENRLAFLLASVDKSSKAITEDSIKYHHVTEETLNSSNTPLPPCKNYLTKSYFKLIESYLLSRQETDQKPLAYELKFLLTFENSFIQHVCLKIDVAKFKFVSIESELINNHEEINFDPTPSESSANDVAFKSTRKIQFSGGQYLMYQIFDFSKSHLVYKKPPDLQINVYKVRDTKSTSPDLTFLGQFLNGTLTDMSNDVLWLFKRELYLNHETFLNDHLFNIIHESIKHAQSLNLATSSNIDQTLSILKRTRTIAWFLHSFFHIMSLFDKSNQIKSTIKLEDESDDTEMEEEEDNEEELSNQSGSNQAANTSANASESSSSIIKSPTYYKSVIRDLTFTIIKYYCIKLVVMGYQVGYEKLTPREQLVLTIQGDFLLKKKLLTSAENLNFLVKVMKLSMSEAKSLEGWVKSKKRENNEYLCELCDKKCLLEVNDNLESVTCESGHLMNRCQKTLLPLSCFTFKKCPLCNVVWNLVDKKDFPHFHFLSNFESCWLCDS